MIRGASNPSILMQRLSNQTVSRQTRRRFQATGGTYLRSSISNFISRGIFT
jgi:hypothetical protein